VGKVGEALDGWGLGGAREETPQRRHHMQTEHLPKRSKRKGCLRILARGFVGIVLLTVALATEVKQLE
jgi:hypothetical protein